MPRVIKAPASEFMAEKKNKDQNKTMLRWNFFLQEINFAQQDPLFRQKKSDNLETNLI